MRQRHRPAVLAALALYTMGVASCSSESGTAPEIERRIVFVTSPSTSAQNRTMLPIQPTLQLRDDQGRLLTESGRVITASLVSGEGRLTGDSVVSTDGTGRAIFTDLGIEGKAGDYTLRFTLAIAAVRYSITAPVSLTAGAAAKIEASGATVLSGQEGAALETLPAVRVTDADDNPVAGVTVTFDDASGGAVTGTTPVTDASGVATLGGWTLSRYPATYTIAARAAGLAGSPVTFTVHGVVKAFEQFAGGELHTCALTVSQSPYCWGENGSGAVGDGSNSNRLVPVDVSGRPTYRIITAGYAHNCALTPLGQAFCWGLNSFGQLGDGSKTNRSAPVAVAGNITFDTLVAGYLHTCGLTSTGAAYCWGFNEKGTVGDNSTDERLIPTQVLGGHEFLALAGGATHTCGIRTDAMVYCWGGNEYGELGDGTNETHLTPVAVSANLTFESLTSRLFHTCGVRPGGAAYCWGRNALGSLGDGGTTNRTAPVAVSGNHSFRLLTAGNHHTCGLTTAGNVLCWGANGSASLGDGTSVDRTVPVPLYGGLTYRVLHAGAYHGCGQPVANSPRCWGGNSRGQLGNGTEASYGEPQPIVTPQPALR